MKSSNVTWGLFFIAMAIFVIVGATDGFGNVSVWTVICACFCGVWFLNGLMNISFGNMLFPLAIIAILFDETLGIEELTPWPVLAAALFGTIGLNMIFGGLKKKRIAMMKQPNVAYEATQSGERFNCKVSFGSSTRYVNCQNLRYANIETAFGNNEVYFDNARLAEAEATVTVKNSFGKTTLYIPKEWNVKMKTVKSFASASEKGKCNKESLNVLNIVGEIAFGELEIVYI